MRRNCLLALVGPLLISAAPPTSLRATADMLGREIPIAIENHQMQPLASSFTDDVKMTANIPNANFDGKKWVLTAFEWNPLKASPRISNVIVGINSIVVIQNIPTDGRSSRGELAPRVDVFHLNADGKIDRVETIIGDAVAHREGSY